MPRRSAESHATPHSNPEPTPLRPPGGLSPSARLIWNQLTESVPASHFRPGDVPLLRSYCESSALADRAAAALAKAPAPNGRPSPWLLLWEKSTRAQASLAIRLRLCPSSRMHARTAGSERPGRNPIDFNRQED